MLLIKNANILTMSDKNYNEGYILIEKGKIKAVGEMSEISKISEINGINKSGAGDIERVIDAAGMYVLPGLIDAHCHVGMWEDSVGFEGDDGNEMTDPITPQLRAIDGVYYADRAFIEARENGVTTVVTGPGSANVIGGQFAAKKKLTAGGLKK